MWVWVVRMSCGYELCVRAVGANSSPGEARHAVVGTDCGNEYGLWVRAVGMGASCGHNGFLYLVGKERWVRTVSTGCGYELGWVRQGGNWFSTN